MNFKIIIPVLLIVLFGIAALISLHDTPTTITKNQDPIKISVDSWPVSGHLFVAEQKGFFEKNNVKVELSLMQDIPNFHSQYTTGDADAIMAVYADGIFYDAVFVPSNVVYVTDMITTADFLVGNVDSIAELKGKTIGVTEMNSFSHLFVLELLSQEGLDSDDVNLILIPSSEVINKIKDGTIDAGHSWNIDVRESAQSLNYNILAEAKDASGIISDVMIFKSSTIDSRPNDVSAIITSYGEAIDYCKLNYEECLSIISENIGWSEEEINENFNSIVAFDVNDNIQIMQDSHESFSLFGSGEIIAKQYVALKQINQIPNFDEFVAKHFVLGLDQ